MARTRKMGALFFYEVILIALEEGAPGLQQRSGTNQNLAGDQRSRRGMEG